MQTLGSLAWNKKTANCCSFKNIGSHHHYNTINYNELWRCTGSKKRNYSETITKGRWVWVIIRGSNLFANPLILLGFYRVLL